MRTLAPSIRRRLFRLVIGVIPMLVITGIIAWPGAGALSAQGDEPLASAHFTKAAPQGFGDRQNGWAWAMQWWKGHLYVGTNRAFHCIEQASLNFSFPELFPYPPTDPDIACTPVPEDLPLRAEIWRWTAPNTWDRVFQSPNDVPCRTSLESLQRAISPFVV